MTDNPNPQHLPHHQSGEKCQPQLVELPEDNRQAERLSTLMQVTETKDN